MEKRIARRVTAGEDGMVLGQFLRSSMSLSKKEISRAKFLEHGICVDGTRKKTTAILKEGELVEVRLETGERTSAQLRSSEKELEILYEDGDVMVLNKPAGLSVHPAGKGSFEGDTLANRLAFYLRRKQEDGVIRLFGRLDKDTSGVVLAAKSRAAAGRLEKQREEGILKKTYLAVCQGVPREMEGEICAPLAVSPEDRKRMCVSEEGKYARTRYQVLKTWNSERLSGASLESKTSQGPEHNPEPEEYSLVSLSLDTGRMHQIRVHMASVGCPLLGDPLYGRSGRGEAEKTDGEETENTGEKAEEKTEERAGEKALIARTALHAAELVFRQPFTGEELCISAPVPKDIARVLKFVVE